MSLFGPFLATFWQVRDRNETKVSVRTHINMRARQNREKGGQKGCPKMTPFLDPPQKVSFRGKGAPFVCCKIMGQKVGSFWNTVFAKIRENAKIAKIAKTVKKWRPNIQNGQNLRFVKTVKKGLKNREMGKNPIFMTCHFLRGVQKCHVLKHFFGVANILGFLIKACGSKSSKPWKRGQKGGQKWPIFGGPGVRKTWNFHGLRANFMNFMDFMKSGEIPKNVTFWDPFWPTLDKTGIRWTGKVGIFG